MKIITIILVSILYTTAFSFQIEPDQRFQLEKQTTTIYNSDATTFVDNSTIEINRQIVWNNYIAQISPESLEEDRKALVTLLPPQKAVKRKRVMESTSRIIYQNLEKMNKEPYFEAEVITNSVPNRPYREIINHYEGADQVSSVVPYKKVSVIKRNGVKITHTEKGLERIEDFDNGTTTVTYRGREIKPIIDNPYDIEEFDQPTKAVDAEVLLVYNRFDVYIDSAYYSNNETDLNQFFDDFEPRFDLLENRTGWSSEKFYDTKLQINVTSTPGCWGGISYPAETNLYLHDDLGDGTCPDWTYYAGATHETLHAINPLPFYFRSWLTEGWSQYEQYNHLIAEGDMTQALVDGYIYNGTTAYNWLDYSTNNYTDNIGNEIQISNGYDITAWMFSMMRDTHNTDMIEYYALLNENLDTLDEAFDRRTTSYYFMDMVVIDLFGRSAGYDFAATKDIWEYDGSSGPGWGVRQWVSTDWYGDASPVISIVVSEDNQTIEVNSVIHNLGEVNYIEMPINIYENSILIDSLRVDIPALDSVVIATPISLALGLHNIRVVADEYNVKIEKDETNNEATDSINLVDADNDNYFDLYDCDDNIASINPGAVEIVGDGIDQDCDGSELCYLDADMDGYGIPSTVGSVDLDCSDAQESYTNNDCDDSNSDVYPGAVEILDNDIDEDCNGADSTCCVSPTGDINNDSGTAPDISDLLYLVDYMFLPPGSAPAPECMKEADVNSDGSSVPDISDLLYLVDYMFLPPGSAPEPADCF